MVVLHVAVRDKKGYVGGLEQKAFRVFENNQPQPVSFFSNQDAPVTVGLLIDSSGSMGANRDRVIAAAVAFAQNSNPDDDIFALGFNENVRAALPAGRALHPRYSDASVGAVPERSAPAVRAACTTPSTRASKYLDRGKYERKVLVLVSDGGDNASSITRAQILAKAQASNAVIYAVGVIDPLETRSGSWIPAPTGGGERRRGVRAATASLRWEECSSRWRTTSATCTRWATFRRRRATRKSCAASASR